jgi:hypothetical protein
LSLIRKSWRWRKIFL